MSINKHLIVSTFSLFFVLSHGPMTAQAAFQWPWEQAAAQEKSSSSEVSKAQAAKASADSRALISQANTAITPAVISQQAAPSRAAISSESPKAPIKSQTAAVPAVSSPALITTGSAMETSPMSFMVKAPVRNPNYEQAVKMQTKLNDLVRLTAEMELVNRSKIGEVQGMIEKAQVNQNTLTKLSSPMNTASKLSKVDAETILLNKKIRAMREEVEKQMALKQDSE